MAGIRSFFDVPIRYAWVTLLVPMLFACKFLFPGFDPWPDDAWPAYPFAWLIAFTVFACILVPIQLCYAHLAPRLGVGDFGTRRAILFHAVTVPACGVLGLLLGGWLVAPLLPPAELDPTREWAEIPFLMFGFTLVAAPIALRGAHYRDVLERSRTRALHAEREALTAQVQALQARIQPHFLFNSLNAVASLIAEDPPRAERALERLSELFRYTLEASNDPTVPLAEELESVEGYLELERLRFEDRLKVSLRVQPGVGSVPIPPLVLQPLVENAVRHGIAPRTEGGRLELEITRERGVLGIRVEDDGPGPGGSPNGGAGVALADLRQRLALLYGDSASLHVGSGPRGGCRVALTLPDTGPPPTEPA